MSVTPLAAAGVTAPAAAPAAAAATTRTPEQQRIHEAAAKFEGIFMSKLVDEMMKSTGADQASPVYAGLMSEKLGDQLAESGGIGLAAMLERQIGGATATDDGSTR